MTRIVTSTPASLHNIPQANKPALFGFHPIVTLLREARNDR